MAKLYQHRTDRTYYTKKFEGGIVTRQIHPDGVFYLKRAGVRLGGEISPPAMSALVRHNWLFTKEEVACWGEMNWSPAWDKVGEPVTIQYPDWLAPHKERQRREETHIALARADRQAEEESRRLAEAKRAEKKRRDRERRAEAKRQADGAERLAGSRNPHRMNAAQVQPTVVQVCPAPVAVAPAYQPVTLFGSAASADVSGREPMRFPIGIGREQAPALPIWTLMLIVALLVIVAIGVGQSG